jgi:hypothetical protein
MYTYMRKVKHGFRMMVQWLFGWLEKKLRIARKKAKCDTSLNDGLPGTMMLTIVPSRTIPTVDLAGSFSAGALISCFFRMLATILSALFSIPGGGSASLGLSGTLPTEAALDMFRNSGSYDQTLLENERPEIFVRASCLRPAKRWSSRPWLSKPSLPRSQNTMKTDSTKKKTTN